MSNKKDETPTEYDIMRAKEFCLKHEMVYPHHTCEPIWDKNGVIERYNITVKHRGSSHIKPRSEK